MRVSRRTSIIVIAAVAILAVVAGVYTPKIMNWGNEEEGSYGDISIQ